MRIRGKREKERIGWENREKNQTNKPVDEVFAGV